MAFDRKLKTVRFPAAALIAAGLTFGATAAAPAKEMIFYTGQTSPQFVTTRGTMLFAQKVEELTKGEITVRVRLGGSLSIPANNMTQAVSENVVQMGEDVFFAGSVPIAGIIRLPGLISTNEQLLKAHPIVLPAAEKAFAARNIVVLATYGGLQYIWGGKAPVMSLGSLKGLKIRASSPEQGEFVKRLGGSAVTITVADVPSALERGVVDGIVTGFGGAVQWKDFIKTGVNAAANAGNAFVIMNKTAYDGLTPDLQQKVKQAAKEAAEWTQTTMIQEEKDMAATLVAGGVKIGQPTPTELAEANKLMESYWTDWAKQQGPEAEALLKQLQAALGR